MVPPNSEALRMPRPPSPEQSHRVANVLARRIGLTEADLRRISEMQARLGLGFTEAALRTGLVTQADLDAVMADEFSEPSVPAASARPTPELTSARDPFSPFSENIRALRTELLLRAPAEQANVFAVMSPGAGEGRSRLAAELAISFAQLGQATLLVDCDLRRARQHALFGADNAHGLARALADGGVPRVEPIAGLTNLWLLTAGPRPDTPLEALSGPDFAEMLSGWRRRYRHVILDTPPAAEYSDGLAIAAHTGRVLLVSRVDRTRHAQMRDLLRRLQSARASVIGAVLNRF